MVFSSKTALNLWHGTLVETVRQDTPDLSSRQMAVLLTVYMSEGPHTVRGLAAMLKISKPAITRAIDKLEKLQLLRRKVDQTDKRNILLQRTVKGSVFLNDFGDLVRAVADNMPKQQAIQPTAANDQTTKAAA